MKHYSSSFDSFGREGQDFLVLLLEEFLSWPETCELGPALEILVQRLIPYALTRHAGATDDEAATYAGWVERRIRDEWTADKVRTTDPPSAHGPNIYQAKGAAVLIEAALLVTPRPPSDDKMPKTLIAQYRDSLQEVPLPIPGLTDLWIDLHTREWLAATFERHEQGVPSRAVKHHIDALVKARLQLEVLGVVGRYGYQRRNPELDEDQQDGWRFKILNPLGARGTQVHHPRLPVETVLLDTHASTEQMYDFIKAEGWNPADLKTSKPTGAYKALLFRERYLPRPEQT